MIIVSIRIVKFLRCLLNVYVHISLFGYCGVCFELQDREAYPKNYGSNMILNMFNTNQELNSPLGYMVGISTILAQVKIF